MGTDTLTLAHVERWWLLAVVVALSVWGVMQHVHTPHMLARLASGSVARRLIALWSPGRSAAKLALQSAALVLLAGAALEPRYGVRETEVSNAGIDLAVAIDASKSMLVKDVVPNRLQGAILEISALMEKLHGGRVALVPFAGIPFVQCPLTTDHEVIRTYLADLKPEDLPVGGSNLGRAIMLASEVLTGERERQEGELRDNLVPQFKGSKHKAILVFSDGEETEPGAIEAAQKAAEKGIQVLTVGIGSAFGDPVPIVGPDGTITGVQKDENGNPVFSKLDMQTLEKIAAASGGQSFRYSGKSVVPAVFAALDALEKAEYTAQYKQLGEDRYQWLLGPALLLLIADTAMHARRRQKRKKRAPVTEPSAAGKALAASLLALLAMGHAQPAGAVPMWLMRENPDVADGRELLALKKHGEALQAFERARASRPEHAILWYDQGVAQAAMGRYEDAITSFSRALGSMAARDRALEADVHQASGTANLLWGLQLAKNAAPAAQDPTATAATDEPGVKFRAAVSSLELALLADRTRADVRRNLELARLYAYPPCRLRDKEREPDDQPQQAQPVQFDRDQREQILELLSCPDDRDHVAVPLEPGDRFSVQVATKADANPAAADPDAPQGTPQLALRILGSDGKTQLRGPAKPGDALQAVDLGRIDRRETVLVEVTNPAEIETPYTLTLKLLRACPRTEDAFEPNDTPETARALTLGEPIKGRLCPVNDDHFALPLLPGQGVIVGAKTKVEVGGKDIELDVLGPDGAVLASGRQVQDALVGRLAAAPTAGTYVVRLRGAIDTEADYELQVQVTPPCRERDDGMEPNDQAAEAKALDPAQLSQPIEPIQLCPGDDDWMAVDLKAGESLFLDLTANVEQLPDAQDLAGQLTVEVWDDKGTLWGRAVGPSATGQQTLGRTLAVLAPPPGTYRVRVTGGGVAPPEFPLPVPPALAATPAFDERVTGLDLAYALKVQVLPPCPAGNDELEPNDAAKDAKPIEVGQERLLRICKGDQDWLALTQKAGQDLQVSARFDMAPGIVELEAFDEPGATSLGKAGVVGPDSKPRPLQPGEDTPEARKGRSAVAAVKVAGAKTDRVVKFRAKAADGVENFYMLRVEEPPPQNDQGQQKQDGNDDQKQDDRKDEQDQKPAHQPQDQQERERQRQQMERHDHNPQNLEAQEALRKSPFRNTTPAKDW
jgi:Ca-activated chloride channel family protein